jgi:hypothetical protein
LLLKKACLQLRFWTALLSQVEVPLLVQVRVSALLALRLVVRVLRLVVRVLLQLEQVLVAEPGLQSVVRWLRPLRMLR